MSDFEDAIVAVCAKKINADFIVSRDDDFMKAGTEIRVISPNQLLQEIS
jgi:predicted nucleic acid-binding protein